MTLPTNLPALAISVRKEHQTEQLRLVWLNVREFLPPLLLAGLIGLNVSESIRPAVVLWVAMILAASPTVFMVGNSILHHRADQRWGTTTDDSFRQRSAQLNHRVWMYRNLFWWYFTPLAAALALFVYSSGDIPLGEGLAIYGVMVAILALVVWMGRRSGRRRYADDAERFESLLKELESTN